MGAKPRSVGRPSKNTLRIELRLDLNDKAAQAVIAEARARGVTVQQHIHDLLIARYLYRPTPQEAELPAPQDGASALSDEWM